MNLIADSKCCTPILSKTLRVEYSYQLETERDRHGQKNVSNFWLQSYPVDPLGKFLDQCKEIPIDEHFTKNFEKHHQRIMNSLTPEERQGLELDLDKPNGKNDINIAAIAKTLNAKLVTEDKGLLRLKNNQKIKLNVYPLHDPEVIHQFNNSILNILASELNPE